MSFFQDTLDPGGRGGLPLGQHFDCRATFLHVSPPICKSTYKHPISLPKLVSEANQCTRNAPWYFGLCFVGAAFAILASPQSIVATIQPCIEIEATYPVKLSYLVPKTFEQIQMNSPTVLR